MSVENELKMIPREEVNPTELLNLLEANGYVVKDNLKVKRQEDTYYDDKNKTLSKSGCSFRIRRKENNAVVTYKSPIISNTEYKQRKELEVSIPETYIQEDGSIMVEDAINLLRSTYKNIEIPEKLDISAKVINNRNKTNVQSKDGTTIEIAFDDLSVEDSNEISYKMYNEIECEVIEGNEGVLNDIFYLIDTNYEITKNNLSKYSRAIKEMKEQKNNMSLDEITICTMLSQIISSTEFEQLKYKGQMIHDYRKTIPDNLNLNNLKNPEYLISKISEMKRKKDYKPGKINGLEDMFLCFFTDMSYKDIEYKLVKFLNENYYQEENTPITNRMLHSQQVMLITGLISRSKEISESEKKTLLCMTSALLHDIGHVPGAHPTEEILGDYDGFFSHEINGRNVIERIISENQEEIIKLIKRYGESIDVQFDEEKIKEYLQKNKTEIKRSIEAHSRTNSEKRGEGTVVQLPREADKICYSTSDIVDIIKRVGHEKQIEFFPEEWKKGIIEKLGKGYEKEKIIKQKLEEIERLINTGNFGEITTTIANTVAENMNDGKTYYDVDQDYWDIINEMIKYVKDLRKTGVIDNKRNTLQNAARIFTIKKFNEALEQTNGNIETAWDIAVEKITKSNDLDILKCINEIKEKAKEQPEILESPYREGGILDETKLKMLNNADRQIKMQPKGAFQISDLQPYLGQKYDTPQPEIIRDTYYNKQNGLSICVREFLGTNKKQLIVKSKKDKEGVTQVERKKYVSTSNENVEIEQLINKFNSEYPDFDIQIPEGKPKCVIQTIRSNVENEQGVVIRKDKSVIITDEGKIQMPETIEIEFNDRKGIKKIKQQLSEFLDIIGTNLRAVSTKETKEEQAMRLIEKEQKSR